MVIVREKANVTILDYMDEVANFFHSLGENLADLAQKSPYHLAFFESDTKSSDKLKKDFEEYKTATLKALNALEKNIMANIKNINAKFEQGKFTNHELDVDVFNRGVDWLNAAIQVVQVYKNEQSILMKNISKSLNQVLDDLEKTSKGFKKKPPHGRTKPIKRLK